LRTLINSRAESRDLRRNAAKDANDKAKPSPGLPDLIVVDGGKGQLSAACAELAKLQLSGIPIIGLAKEFEEIYRPGEGEPRWARTCRNTQRVAMNLIRSPARNGTGSGRFPRASWTNF
jgi:excinuclease UvrABC nuclease subunit